MSDRIKDAAGVAGFLTVWFLGWYAFGYLVWFMMNNSFRTWFFTEWPLTMVESGIVGLLIGLFVMMYIIKMERAT